MKWEEKQKRMMIKQRERTGFVDGETASKYTYSTIDMTIKNRASSVRCRSANTDEGEREADEYFHLRLFFDASLVRPAFVRPASV